MCISLLRIKITEGGKLNIELIIKINNILNILIDRICRMEYNNYNQVIIIIHSEEKI